MIKSCKSFNDLVFERLLNQEQFNKLKKGDFVIVDWGFKLSAYKIHGILPGNELLLSKKKNHYFIIDMYLDGTSNAKIAYLVTK